jgi:hypothetical protein
MLGQGDMITNRSPIIIWSPIKSRRLLRSHVRYELFVRQTNDGFRHSAIVYYIQYTYS